MRALTREHFVQPTVVLAILQMGAVLAGVFGVGLAMKASDTYGSFGEWPWRFVAMRNFGIFLLAIPVTWFATTLYLENKESGRWTPRWSVATGVVILGFLAWKMLVLSLAALFPPISSLG